MKPFITIKELRSLLDSQKISVEEVVDFYLQRLEKYNGKLNAVLEHFDRESLKESFFGSGVLAGIPGLLKDNICQKDRITSCGSKIL